MKPFAKDGHHTTPVAPHVRVDRAIIVGIVSRLNYPARERSSTNLVLPKLVIAREFSLHVLLKFDTNQREWPGVVHSTDAASVGRARHGA